MQLIVDQPARYDFSNGANAKEIAAAAVDTQSDLDLVASCASAAINSPAGAKFPKDFADDNKKIFPVATMPAILPLGKPRPNPTVLVPNCIGMNVIDAIRLILTIGLLPDAGFFRTGDLDRQARVIEQTVPPSTEVSKGSLLKVFYGTRRPGIDSLSLQIAQEFGILVGAYDREGPSAP